MLIVSDTSPIICLAVCGKLDLLDRLFDHVYVPQAVFDELAVPNRLKADEIAKWAKPRIVPAKETVVIAALSMTLDLGESEAISLYLETGADYLLIDEKKGRSIAAKNGIRVIGSIGILLLAKQKGIIATIKPTLDAIMQTSFRISGTLYRQVLDIAGE